MAAPHRGVVAELVQPGCHPGGVARSDKEPVLLVADQFA